VTSVKEVAADFCEDLAGTLGMGPRKRSVELFPLRKSQKKGRRFSD